MTNDFQDNFLRLTNSDIKISLDRIVNEKKKNDVEKTFQKIFDFFDNDKSGNLSKEEIDNLYTLLVSAAMINDNLEVDDDEAELMLDYVKNTDGKTLKDEKIAINEVFGFVKSLESDGISGPQLVQFNQSEITMQEEFLKNVLINKLKYNPRLIERLLSERRIGNFDKTTLRFGISEIKEIANRYQNNSGLAERLLSEKMVYDDKKVPRFDGYEISMLLDIYPQNPELVERLISDKMVDFDGKEIPRFGGYEISILFEKYSQNPELTERLLSEQTINSDGKKDWRFNGYDIEGILEKYSENPELTERLLSEQMMDSGEKTVPRFSGNEIAEIMGKYSENSELVERLLSEQMMDSDEKTVPRFSGDDIAEIMDKYSENPELAERLLSEVVNQEGKDIPRFNVFEITNLIESYDKYDNKVLEELINDPQKTLSGYDILMLIKNQGLWSELGEIQNPHNASEPLLKTQDIANILSDYQYICNNSQYYIPDLSGILDIFGNQDLINLIADNKSEDYCIGLSKQRQDNGYYQVVVSDSANNKSIIDLKFDNNNSPSVVSVEKSTKNGNITTAQREFSDGTKIEEEIGTETDIFNGKQRDIQQSYKKTFFDSNKNKVRTEEVIPSDKIPGEYIINTYTNKNNHEKKESVGSVKTSFITGKTRARKRLTATDGTVTREIKIIGKNTSGNIYTIQDKDGNVLFHTKRSLKKIDENHYQSEVDGQYYDVKFEDGKVTASKTDKKGNIIDTVELGSDILDPKLTDLFKQLTGDYFFKIKACGLQKIEIGGKAKERNACYSNADNAIYMSEELKNDPFVFAHELGHALDFTVLQYMSSDPEFIRIWTEGIDAYKSNSGDTEALAIQYFTDETRSKNSAKEECVAEAHAICSGFRKTDFASKLGTRSIILEQNCPRLIAYVSNAINNPEEYIANRMKNRVPANEGIFY